MTRRTEFLERILNLQRDGTPFAVATVVARRAPVSAHLGDRAFIFADARMEGFVGGACSREIVRQQALDSLRLQQGRLVSISPDATGTTTDDERVAVPMMCASEGAVDVYIEPFVPSPALVVVGATPVADALSRLARAMDYIVTQAVDAQERPHIASSVEPLGITVIGLDGLEDAMRARATRPSVVVASQGHYDEEALEVVLSVGSPYVGLLASRPRGATVRAYLEARGAPGVDAIRSPVGLDLGARSPSEVALSILAEIVRARPSTHSGTEEAPHRHVQQPTAVPVSPIRAMTPIALEIVAPQYAIDPVCGMNVDVATARHKLELDETTYYFCCPHCHAAFQEQPQEFLRPTT